jgi:hypothetical protein
MPTPVTINLTLPTFSVGKATHQRIVALSSLLAAGAVALTAYGPGFGLPAADAVYAASGANVLVTILRAIFPAPDDTVKPAV